MNTDALFSRRRALAAAALTALAGVAGVAGLSGCATPVARAADADARDVAAASERLRQLMLAPDGAALGALLHERLTYGHSAGKVDSKSSLIQSLLTRSSAFARIDVSQQSVDVVGDVAHVRHVFDADTVPVGRPAAKVHLQVLGVWLRTATGWQLLARQAVILPA
jgi:hypothetical protein